MSNTKFHQGIFRLGIAFLAILLFSFALIGCVVDPKKPEQNPDDLDPDDPENPSVTEVADSIIIPIVTDLTDINLSSGNIEISWGAVEGANTYEVLRGKSRLAVHTLLGSTDKLVYTDSSANAEKYENYYKVIPKTADGKTIVQLEWTRVSVVISGVVCHASSYDIYRTDNGSENFSATPVATVSQPNFTEAVADFDTTKNLYKVVGKVVGETDGEEVIQEVTVDNRLIAKNHEQIVSFEKKLFGPNVKFYDPDLDVMTAIAAEITDIGNEMWDQEFGLSRYALYLKPGSYTGFNTWEVGFYTNFAGLGKTPDETKLFGTVRTRPHLGNNNVTCTFWRSIENLEIAKNGTQSNAFQWGVSQAAPMRRINTVNVNTQFDRGGNASGGFAADCYFGGSAGSGPQQQWYTRNSHFTSALSGINWNKVTQGSTGASYANNYSANSPNTWIDETPIIREKPFLYLDSGDYKVFVPALRKDAKGVSWKDDDGNPTIGEGKSLDIINDFYVAKPSDSADSINAQLSAGKHLFLTPGFYLLDKPLRVTKADTVILGTGYATLVPGQDNRDGAMLVEDVSGVTVASVMFDAHYKSSYLLRLGNKGANQDHSANPSLLADVFLRVGGLLAEKTHAEVSAQINSNNVIGDHFWIWRADHGRGVGREGVGWEKNTAPYGLIVSGNDVTIYGLFVEHYQKYQTLWLGEKGRVYFYQNELPYDPTNQDVYMSHDGQVKGFAAYKVANSVNEHYAIGLGMYGVFNRQADGIQVFLDNAMEVPNKPGVIIEHACILELGGRGGINSIINGAGDSVMNASRKTIVDYSNGTANTSSAKKTGTQPEDEVFIIPE